MSAEKHELKIPDGYVRLKGSERRASTKAKLIGQVDDKETFPVTIVLRRRADGPPFPDFDYFTKTPPRRRMRLSREEFTEKYGAHPDEIKAVEEFAKRNGLIVESSHAGRRHVVEHDIILFETDIPAQHMWGPESSKNYRVLWEEKLNAVR